MEISDGPVKMPAYARGCGILALTLAIAAFLIPVIGVLYIEPLAIAFGVAALYGRDKMLGIITLIVVMVNFLVSPTFWVTIFFKNSDPQGVVNRWLLYLDLAGIITMLYLAIRKPEHSQTTSY